MKTKILLLLTALLMGAATGFAQSGTAGPLTWTLSDSTLTISGTGAMPDYFSDLTVPWYSCRSSITGVIIEDGVTSIGEQAFQWCRSLTSATIGNSVTGIGNYVFSNCSALASVTIPNSVTSIGDGAFSGCESLAQVTIPNSVTSIGALAFYRCHSLTSITIPASATEIGQGAFYDSRNLTAIDVHENNTAYVSENGILFNKAKTTLIQYPTGKPDANYTIPNGVTGIGQDAFYVCVSLTSVIISDGVINIGNHAFLGCSRLRSITIPNSVTDIGPQAFDYCNVLASVITLNPEPQAINSNVFGHYTTNIGNATLYVPAESVGTYEAAPVWQDFGTITAYVPSAIDAPATAGDVCIYPNPAKESFRINGLSAPTSVIITDLSGRTVLQQTVRSNEMIPAGHWPKGVYIVRVNGQSMKIIKY
jgi:hypothetical protein